MELVSVYMDSGISVTYFIYTATKFDRWRPVMGPFPIQGLAEGLLPTGSGLGSISTAALCGLSWAGFLRPRKEPALARPLAATALVSLARSSQRVLLELLAV